MTTPLNVPGRTLRIGVTGARTLEADQLQRLGDQVTGLLRDVATHAKAGGVTRLELLSPLAEGADRLVAACALGLESDPKYSLICPMPFPRGEYEKDFNNTEGSLDEFNRIIIQADPAILELDGKRVSDLLHPDGSALTPEEQARADQGLEARAYEAVGRLIVRNCDLLIAIWDGLPGHGKGGTADTVRYAATSGPPVVWIDAVSTADPRWIEETHDLRRRAPPHAVGDRIALYLKRLLEEPRPREHGGQGSWLHRVVSRLHGRISKALGRQQQSPLTIFLAERRHRVWGPWKVNVWFMDFMNWRPFRHAHPRPPHASPPARQAAAQHWLDLFRSPDERAGEYNARYRSSYVWVFGLAATALSAAAAALAFPECHDVKISATGVELAALVLIMGLIIADCVGGWQTRGIEYRLIAELCRKQQALAPLGWVVPRASEWAGTDPEPEPAPKCGAEKSFIEPIPWVSWLFSAWLRDAPLPTGTIDAAWVETARKAALHDLIDKQIAYHENRCVRSHRAGQRLVHLGETLFLAVLILVAVKFGLLWGNTHEQDLAMHDRLTWLGFLGAMLPALSAAFVGIRAYAELEMLAEQSEAMLKAMERAKGQIGELDPKAPLASQTLGVALAAVATLMLEDLEGWARLFRGKVLDA